VLPTGDLLPVFDSQPPPVSHDVDFTQKIARGLVWAVLHLLSHTVRLRTASQLLIGTDANRQC